MICLWIPCGMTWITWDRRQFLRLMRRLILQVHWKVCWRKRIFIGFLWLMLEFLFWTGKALTKVKDWTCFWKVWITQESITLEKYGQEKCISWITCIPTRHSFGRNNSTDCIKKYRFRVSGSIWTNHQILEATNQLQNTTEFSNLSQSTKWPSMSTLNITVLLIRKIPWLTGKSILTTAIPPQSQLLISSKNMEGLSSSVEATVWVPEDMQDIGLAITLPLGDSWDFPSLETFCIKSLVFKWSVLIFADSMEILLNNSAQDGPNWVVCIPSQEIIIKTLPKINNLMFLEIMCLKLLKPASSKGILS